MDPASMKMHAISPTLYVTQAMDYAMQHNNSDGVAYVDITAAFASVRRWIAVPVAYMDYMAVPIIADKPAGIMVMIRRTFEIALHVLSRFRFKLNFTVGKSNATVRIVGPGAEAVRLQLLIDAHAISCMSCDNSFSVPVEEAYQHLGRQWPVTASHYMKRKALGLESISDQEIFNEHAVVALQMMVTLMCMNLLMRAIIKGADAPRRASFAAWSAELSWIRAVELDFGKRCPLSSDFQGISTLQQWLMEIRSRPTFWRNLLKRTSTTPEANQLETIRPQSRANRPWRRCRAMCYIAAFAMPSRRLALLKISMSSENMRKERMQGDTILPTTFADAA